MLQFFRKYERYIFIVITVVIIISFSFFGTYNTLQRSEVADKTAFTAIDGTRVPRSEVEDLVRFISTDNEDKLLLGGAWGPNFLNDGVIKKDFLETGFAQPLIAQFANEFRSDLETKHNIEKRYVPFVHPQAKFISAANAWKMIYPELETQLSLLQEAADPTSKQAVDARVKLYLAERKFPEPMLRRILRYQEKQYSWITPDPNLNQADLSLFKYHFLEDWFTPRFTRLIAEYIINSAMIASEKGFKVTKEEALADLLRNAEISFQQNSQNPYLGVGTTGQYFDEQLRRLGMDQSKAVNLWQKVLLFRRLFHSDGNSVLVDSGIFAPLQAYSLETVNGKLYRLPNGLRISDFLGLQKFEVYLDAVSKKGGNTSLELPTKFRSPDEVAKSAPGLVQRRYLLNVAKVDKKSLQVKVGIRQAWEWEVADSNWEKLKKQFPELGVKLGTTKQERYLALDSLDQRTRGMVDGFAREAIVDENPDWLKNALKDATLEQQEVSITKKGGNPFFPGLKDPEDLIKLLDQYPKSTEALSHYSPDGETFFKIQVLDKSPKWEIMTFSEARQDSLDKILYEFLEKQYEKVRDKDPKKFQNADGTWKSFASVRNQVAEVYFSPIIEAIKKDYIAANSQQNKDMPMINDFAASLRFYAYMRGLRDKFMKDPEQISTFIRQLPPAEEKNKLPQHEAIADQWKIDAAPYKMERSTSETPLNKEEVFALKPNDWSSVSVLANGDTAFFHLLDKQVGRDPVGLYEIVMGSHRVLSDEAQNLLMLHILAEMDAKKALSLDYLRHDHNEDEE